MQRIEIGGPYFEDLKVGQVFEDAPGLTITAGHAAFHQALFGDRMRLPLDAALCEAVTGSTTLLAHPMLVCNIAIGQTTGPTQRVRANLFYRGLVLQRPVFVGDTLRTRTEVVAMKQNRRAEGKPATGLVALEVHVENQRGDSVLDFWRCPMIPLRDAELDTGHADSFDDIPSEIERAALSGAVPGDWRLEEFRTRAPGPHLEDLVPGTTYAIDARDTVTAAPELVRMTLNMAKAHTDAGESTYAERLVYGGHTIAVSCAQMSRALPNVVTVLAWRACDHTGPVFEGDILRTEVTIESVSRAGDAGLADLRACTFAVRDEGEESMVLDWRLVALMA